MEGGGDGLNLLPAVALEPPAARLLHAPASFHLAPVQCNSVSGSQPSDAHPHGTGIQGEFGLSLLQAGVLAGSMMAGVGTSALLFARLAQRRHPWRLIGAGTSLYVAGAAACAAAPSYAALLAARVAVGAGAGPFISLASPLVDDAAPARAKSVWLALLFLCIPTGFAGGYIAGGWG